MSAVASVPASLAAKPAQESTRVWGLVAVAKDFVKTDLVLTVLGFGLFLVVGATY